MEITLDDAKLIAVALIQLNNKLVEEYEKIAQTPNVSIFIQEAAIADYQKKTEEYTKLHLRLAKAFPELTTR